MFVNRSQQKIHLRKMSWIILSVFLLLHLCLFISCFMPCEASSEPVAAVYKYKEPTVYRKRPKPVHFPEGILEPHCRVPDIPETEPDIPDEYYTAYEVWKVLTDYGYSEVVTAGIIGNMSIEVGGQTLCLDHTLYGAGGYFYGLCQWNADAYLDVHGSDLDYQIQFLLDTIEYEFDMFETAFDISYADFLSIEDPAYAALVFAMIYERCDSGTYGAREYAAEMAYEYFMEVT